MAENRSRFISCLSHGNLAYFAGNIFVPHTDEEYERTVALLDSLIDEVGEDESHPLADRSAWRLD
jgi:hypothetical protein